MLVLVNQIQDLFDVSYLAARFPAAQFESICLPVPSSDQLNSADILVTSSTLLSVVLQNTTLNSFRNLKWIHLTTSGVDVLANFVEQLDEIVVTSTENIHTKNVAEHAMALLLACARALPKARDAQGAQQWSKAELWPETTSLANATLMIVGMGAIGQAIAKRAKSFEMRIMAVSRSDDMPEDVDLVVKYDQLNQAVSVADFIVLATSLRKDTLNIIDSTVLQSTKGTAAIINVARGALIDEDALIEALDSGRIRYAALDAFACEPLASNSPLWTRHNVIVTPHCAGAGTNFGRNTATAFEKYMRIYEIGGVEELARLTGAKRYGVGEGPHGEISHGPKH